MMTSSNQNLNIQSINGGLTYVWAGTINKFNVAWPYNRKSGGWADIRGGLLCNTSKYNVTIVMHGLWHWRQNTESQYKCQYYKWHMHKSKFISGRAHI